jgi:hypothetical protein
MTAVLPKGDRVRKAIRWISDERMLDEGRDFPKLVADACSRFNLSPLEEEFLHDFYADSGEQD